MIRLIKMDLFKLKKSKMFWISLIVVFVGTILIPVIGKIFAEILLNVSANMDDNTAMAAEQLAEALSKPADFSGILRNPLGGTILPIIVLISVTIYMNMDITGGFVKTIAGQIPSRGYLAVSKFIVSGVHNLCMMLSGVLGSIVGISIIMGINFDSGIPEGLLDFFAKFISMWGVCAVILMISSGLASKALSIVAAVVFGTGSLSLIYLPLNMAVRAFMGQNTFAELSMTNNEKVFDIAYYAPDQQFLLTEIDPLIAISGGLILILVFGFLTLRLVRTRDVK